MKDLTEEQKIAVMRLLLDLVQADGYTDEREIKYFNMLAGILELDKSLHAAVQQKNSLLALVEIDRFPEIRKREFALIMGKMIVADEQIHYKEVEIYNAIRHFCNLDLTINEALEDIPLLEWMEDEWSVCEQPDEKELDLVQ